MEKTIKIKDQEISYRIRNNRGNSMRLSVGYNGLLVSKPWFVNQKMVESFLFKKIDWIIDKLKIFSKRIVENNHQNSYQNYQKNKKNSYIFIENKIKELNKVYNFKYSKISIRNQKTRWGSCSRRGNLNFSYKLIFLPEKLANYVIVHELCHLKEFNHSLAFWNLVSLSVPDFKAIRKELRNFTFDKNLFL